MASLMEKLAKTDRRPIRHFNVEGFADKLPENQDCPVRLPPIFRLRNRDFIIVPPFRLRGEVIVGGQIITEDELREFVEDGRATETPSYRAKPNFVLWIDESGTLGYNPSDVVKQAFLSFTKKNYGAAKSAFEEHQYHNCIELAEGVLGAEVRPYHSYALRLMSKAYLELSRNCGRLLAAGKSMKAIKWQPVKV